MTTEQAMARLESEVQTTRNLTRQRVEREVRGSLRVTAIERELRIAAKVLNRDVLDLRVVDAGPAPAWTDLTRISLNRAMLPEGLITREDIAVWVGAAMHELGHTLFTPRADTDLYRRLEAAAAAVAGIMPVFNAVEDQRQERAIISRFAPMRGYLAAAAIRLILSNGEAGASWPLIAGRTWLPVEARAEARRVWAEARGEESAAGIAALIGEYQSLTDPGTAQAITAARVIVDLAKLLNERPPQPEQPEQPSDDEQGEPSNEQGEGGGDGGQTQSDDEAEAQGPSEDYDADDVTSCDAPIDTREGEAIPTPESDLPTAADADDELAPEGEGDEADEDGAGEAEGEAEGDDEGEGQGGGEGEPEGEPEGEQTGEGQGEGEAEGGEADDTDTEGDAAGQTPDATAGQSVEAELADLLAEAVEDLLAQPDVARDLGEYRDAIEVAANPMPEAERAERNVAPDAEAMRTREDLTDTIAELHAQAQAGWNRGTSSGRVNVRRLHAPALRTGTLFDRYQPDALQTTATALAVLVDVSNSMKDHEADMTRAVWAIRHAADAGDVDLNVIGFGGRTRVLATSDDEPGESMPWINLRDGSTLPASAVELAYGWLTHTEAKHKLFLILSDGSWGGDGVRAEALIGLMGQDGIETMSLGFGSSAHANLPHGAGRFLHLDNLADLPRIVADMVEERMRDGLVS